MHKSWQVADGLPSDNIQAICQTNNGYLWFGTAAGLIRFDGLKFTVFDKDNTSALGSNTILSLSEDDRGVLWIATTAGLVTMKDGVFSRFNALDPALEEVLSVVFAGPNHTIWIGTRTSGLYRYRDGVLRSFTTDDGLSDNHITSIVERQMAGLGAEIWVGTGKGLNRFQGETLTVFYPEIQVKTLYAVNNTGHLWLATTQGEVRIVNERSPGIEHFEDPGLQQVNAIFIDRLNNQWIGASHGLYLKQGSAFTPYSEQRALFDDAVTVIAADQEDSLWIGTASSGIWYIRKERFATYTDRDGVPSSPIALVSGDPSGSVTCAVENRLYRFENGRFFPEAWWSSKDPAKITALHRAKNGDLYVGFADGRVMIHSQEHQNISTLQSPNLLGSSIISITQDRQNRLWIASARRFARFDQGEWSTFDIDTGPYQGIALLFVDGQDSLWIGTDGAGLYRRQGLEMTRFTMHTGLSSNRILSMAEDSDGNLWIGTQGRGLMLLKEGTYHHFTRDDGLPDNTFRTIVADDMGRLWSNTSQGIVRIDIAALIDRAKGKTQVIPHMIYGLNHGLESLRTPGLGNSSVWQSPDGNHLWFGMDRGISVVNPRQLYTKKVPPGIHIETFLVDGRPQDLRHYIEVDASAVSIEIHFTGLSFTAPEDIRFKYCLFGQKDASWVDLGTVRDRVIRFTGLDAGRYRLVISATNSNSPRFENSIALGFFKRPSMYQTSGFFLTAAAAFLIIVFSAYALGKRVLTKRQKKLEAVHRRLASVDALKSQILTNTSHELRTPIHGIIGLAESLIEGSAQPVDPNIRYNLGIIRSSGHRLLALINDILDLSRLRNRAIELTLRPVDLNRCVTATVDLLGPLLRGKPVSLENRLPAPLPAVLADEARLLQILNNLVGNAIKFTNEGHIAITAEPALDKMTITVSDSGIGIPEAFLDSIFESFEQVDATAERQYSGTGIGLSITRKLVEIQGGAIRVSSRPNVGSEFVFTLPITDDAVPATLKDRNALHPRPAGEVRVVPHKETTAKKQPVILTVDDEAVNQQVLQQQLSQTGYSVEQAFSGEAALAYLAQNEKPSLMLLDIMMPGISGYQVCQKVREQYAAAELPIIMLTVKDRVEDLVKGFSAGANDYLPKPFSRDELLSRIHAHIALSNCVTEEKQTLEETVAGHCHQIEEMRDELRQKYAGSGVSDADLEHIAGMATELMEREKIYQDETLSIGKLAAHLNVSPNHLSYALNGHLGQNFHVFVNTHRVKEVKEKLIAPAHRDDSILIIAFDAGFKSKSTFNTFFKTTTGMTPSQYRKKYQRE